MTEKDIKKDDLDAVRKIVEAISGFEPEVQERILRWAREKAGLEKVSLSVSTGPKSVASESIISEELQTAKREVRDIRSFIDEKMPTTDNEFSAAVAYYYRFEAPESERKDSINAEILENACRLVGRKRPPKALWTLINAERAGLLDKKKGGRGLYSLSTVGENLVAMALGSDIAKKKQFLSNRRKSNNVKNQKKGK